MVSEFDRLKAQKDAILARPHVCDCGQPCNGPTTRAVAGLYEARKALGTRLTALALEVDRSIHADIWGAFMALEGEIVALLNQAPAPERSGEGDA